MVSGVSGGPGAEMFPPPPRSLLPPWSRGEGHPAFGTCSVAPGTELKFHPQDHGLQRCPSPPASEIQLRRPPRGGPLGVGGGRGRKTGDDGRATWGRTHVSAADSLQQEPGHFCLPVKLGLGHSELLLGLGRAQCENVGQQQ